MSVVAEHVFHQRCIGTHMKDPLVSRNFFLTCSKFRGPSFIDCVIDHYLLITLPQKKISFDNEKSYSNATLHVQQLFSQHLR